MSEKFDLVEYLQQELPGFEFTMVDVAQVPGMQTLRAQTRLTLGIEADINPVHFPVPQWDHAQLMFAREIVEKARADASAKTGLNKVWEQMQTELRHRYEAEFRRVQTEAEHRIQQEVGKAYLAGKAAGRAEEMAFANGEEDDE